MTTCPCLDCEFRHVGCHAQCAPYRMWKEENSREAKRDRVHDADVFLHKSRQRIKKKVHVK